MEEQSDTLRPYISQGSDWTFELLREYDQEIGRVAKHYGLDTYPNQIEVITSEQMIEIGRAHV